MKATSTERKRKRGMRRIVVNGIEYRYSVGKQYTKFDSGAVVPNWKLAGHCNPDTFDRGQYKRTSDGMVTPQMIADYLKTVTR